MKCPMRLLGFDTGRALQNCGYIFLSSGSLTRQDTGPAPASATPGGLLRDPRIARGARYPPSSQRERTPRRLRPLPEGTPVDLPLLAEDARCCAPRAGAVRLRTGHAEPTRLHRDAERPQGWPTCRCSQAAPTRPRRDRAPDAAPSASRRMRTRRGPPRRRRRAARRGIDLGLMALIDPSWWFISRWRLRASPSTRSTCCRSVRLPAFLSVLNGGYRRPLSTGSSARPSARWRCRSKSSRSAGPRWTAAPPPCAGGHDRVAAAGRIGWLGLVAIAADSTTARWHAGRPRGGGVTAARPTCEPSSMKTRTFGSRLRWPLRRSATSASRRFAPGTAARLPPSRSSCCSGRPAPRGSSRRLRRDRGGRRVDAKRTGGGDRRRRPGLCDRRGRRHVREPALPAGHLARHRRGVPRLPRVRHRQALAGGPPRARARRMGRDGRTT